MDHSDLAVPQQGGGATRRQLLRAGAVGGAVVWAAPTVQVLTMSAVSAQVASPVCGAVGRTRGTADNLLIRVGGASNNGTSATSEQVGLGGPDEGEVGSATPSLGPVSARTDTARSVSEVTTVQAMTAASSAVEELTVELGASDLVVRGILSQASAVVTADGTVTLDGDSTVASVTFGAVSVSVPMGAGSVVLPPAPLPALVFLDFNTVVENPGVRTGEITVTALRVRVPSLGIDITAGRSYATATYPPCLP